MGLLGIWYANFFGAESHAILPYDQYLSRFAAYFQQGDMESNGKSVTLDGRTRGLLRRAPSSGASPAPTGSTPSTSSSTRARKLIPCDFLAPARTLNPLGEHHAMLLSNFFAQTEALMRGKTEAEARRELEAQGISGDALALLARAKSFPGNRPSNSFLFKELTPRTLGTLIALYEHKIFTQGAVWNINSYDQMGVELGKKLAGAILKELPGQEPVTGHDSSTNGLINYYKMIR